jgi:hypothetical protein
MAERPRSCSPTRKNAELWKALKSAMTKTVGSLLIVATTSGRGQENLAFEIVDRARKVASGEIDDRLRSQG